jgi:hypothetical protein
MPGEAKRDVKCVGVGKIEIMLRVLKIMVLFYVNIDWLFKRSFARFKMGKEVVVPEFFTQEEIEYQKKQETKTLKWLEKQAVKTQFELTLLRAYVH